MIITNRKYIKAGESGDQRHIWRIMLLLGFLLLLLIPSPVYAQKRKENKGQKKNAVSTAPNPKKDKKRNDKNNAVTKPTRDSSRKEKDIGKNNKDNVGKRGSKKAKEQNGTPIKSSDSEKRLKERKLDGRNNVPIGDRGSKRAKRTHGIPVERSEGVIRKKRDELGNSNMVPIGRRDAIKAKEQQKNPVEHKLPVVRKKSEASTAITPKVPVIDHRKKNLEMKRKEGKLMTARMPKRNKGLPKENPIEYGVPSSRDKEMRTREMAKYSGSMKLPTVPHAGRIARKKSRMLLNYSGKLNIAKPANDRKTYYKLSRKTSTYMGDLKVTWLHYHHRHPSLWRMGRKRDKASSAEVWRNRKMPKRSKYDPGERKIWQNDNNSTTH